MTRISAIVATCILISQVSSFVVSEIENSKCKNEFINYSIASYLDERAVIEMKDNVRLYLEHTKNDGKTTREEYIRYVEQSSEWMKNIEIDRFDLMDIDKDGVLDEKDENKIKFLSIFFQMLFGGEDTNIDYTISKDEYKHYIDAKYPLVKDTYEDLFEVIDKDGNEKLDLDDFKATCKENE